jgi:hypothetical protein
MVTLMAERTAKDVKAEKLAAALRENLKRRKAQARGRAAEGGSGQGRAPGIEPSEARKPDLE